MKTYKEYMDHISVSDTFHRRIMLCVDRVKSNRHKTIIRPYAMVFACLVLLLGIGTIPRLIEDNVPATKGKTPSTSHPGVSISIPEVGDEFKLFFNKADMVSGDNIYIWGHFWKELTAGDLQPVFPGVIKTYTVTGTANFQGDGTLINIEAHAVSDKGYSAYIQTAPEEVILDYVLDGKAKTSDVLGTAVTGGYFKTDKNSKGQRNIIYFASFKLAGISYYVELGGSEEDEIKLEQDISTLIGLIIQGGAADLSAFDNPTIPELREEDLTLKEAQSDADFGGYMPASLPSGFTFESALRFTNQEEDYLSALWIKGMGDIHWRISTLGERGKERITSATDKENYDLSLYPIPRADSVPHELREIVNDPIFLSEELTLEVVKARAYEVEDSGDEAGYRMNFGILYGDVLVEINVKGASPEEILEMLQH